MATRRPGIRALGVDPGTIRVGIAVSDPTGTIASPLTVLHRTKSRQHDLEQLAQLAREEQVEIIVIGLPLNMDGSISKAAKAATAMGRQLATVIDVPVEMHDERRTSAQAERDMFDAGLNGVQRRRVVDKIAAAIMLQSWLDARRFRLDNKAGSR